MVMVLFEGEIRVMMIVKKMGSELGLGVQSTPSVPPLTVEFSTTARLLFCFLHRCHSPLSDIVHQLANMDSDLHSPVDSGGAKAAFHKPSNDSSSRKYRRRSPVSGSSSSDVEPARDRSSTPTHSLQRKDDNRDYKRSRHSSSNSNRHSDRRSYNDRRHDDHKRRDKYADEDQKSFHKGSYSDKYSRDRSDGSGHRGRDRDKRDEKRDYDYPRTSKGGKSESLPTFEESRGHRSGHHNHHKDTSWRDSKELDDTKYGGRFEKGKSYNQEARELKDRHFKEPKELVDDKTVLAARKSKFSMDKDPEFSKDGNSGSKHVGVTNEVQSSSSKQGQELVGKATVEQEFVKDSDIDAAKIAAMKAAELVNRNLIGTGIMSTDQKKKLLWGSKKSTATEESGHKWDTSMFSDRERQEKFKKLMGVKVDPKPDAPDATLAEKQKELQMDLEKQYTAGLRRRDGRTVGLGL
ncbi:unnamed protein product [Lactuca saligna]|uniref:Small acidic protein-like domain-containing protein n=1 Tax=Lactuca saligna TaxID=75948 RepID=A0AA35ZYX5_LACSI|nr:unnamed protein product [Lactuca saligna]